MQYTREELILHSQYIKSFLMMQICMSFYLPEQAKKYALQLRQFRFEYKFYTCL